MNILITGGGGLLGSELGRNLSQNKNDHIYLLVRRTPHMITANTTYLHGDILNSPEICDLLAENKIDIVIHAAAMVSFSPRDRKELFETNVTGTANLINACLLHDVKRFIHISSVAAIGKPENVLNSKSPVTINEEFKWTETPLNSNYAKSKYLAELEVWRGQAEGLHTVILNPSVILGAGDLSKSSTQLFNYVYQGNKFLTAGGINYVDLNDLINVIKIVLESQVENQRYIVSAGRVSYSDFFGTLARNMHVKGPSIQLGNLATEILWRLEAFRSILTGSKPLITKETSVSARSNVYFDSAKLLNQFPVKFTPLEETVSRICNELKLT